MSMNKTKYQTSDLCLVTTISQFLPILEVDGTNSKRSLFSFSESPELSEIITTYWNGSIRVEPKQFFNQLKLIKSRIYSGV